MKKFIRQNLFGIEVVIVTLMSLFPLLWFSSGHMVVGYDSGYPINYLNYFSQRTFTWFDAQNFGWDLTPDIGLGIFHGFHAVLAYLGLSTLAIQHITFPLWFFGIGMSFYLFIRYLFPEPKQWSIRFVGVIFYLFNLHLFSYWLQGEEPALTAYILLPLSTLLTFKFLREEISPIMTAILFSLLLFFFNGGGVHGLPLLGPTLLLIPSVVIFTIFVKKDFAKKRFFIRLIKTLLFFLPIFFLTNAYYIVPFLKEFQYEFSTRLAAEGGVGGAAGWAQYIGAYTSFANLFRLQGVLDIYINPMYYLHSYITNPLLIVGSFIFPILAYLSGILATSKEEKRIVLFFIAFSLIALFFTAGAHMPSGIIYIFLLEKIPGFAAFRSAYYKFDPAVYFSFAVLIGVSIYYLSERLKRVSFFLPLIFVLFILLYNFPFFQKQNFTFNAPFTTMPKIPQYVLDFSHYENALPATDTRTLIVPAPNYGYTIWAYTWGYWGTYPIFPLLTNKNFISFDSNYTGSEQGVMLKSLYSYLRNNDIPDFLQQAKLLQIDRVIVTRDTAYGYWYGSTENPNVLEKNIQQIPGIKTAWHEGEWTIYTLPLSNESRIQAIEKLAVLEGDYTQSTQNLLQSNHFIVASQVPDALTQQLPVSEKIHPLTCISCTLLTFAPLPSLSSVTLNPNSFLYPIKLYKDSKTIRSLQGDDLTNAYVGLSLKRFFELQYLSVIVPDAFHMDMWVKSAQLLDTYWGNITMTVEQSYIPENRYDELGRILAVAQAERDQLINIYEKLRDKNNNALTYYLGNSIEKISKTVDMLTPVITQKDWLKNFIYAVPPGSTNILIEKSSLPLSPEGTVQLPVGFDSLRISTSEAFSGDLSLSFRNISQVSSFARSKVLFAEGEKYCLNGKIVNLDWTKTYRISAVTQYAARSVIYVKETHPVFLTQDTPVSSNTYVIPDQTYRPASDSPQGNSFSFTPKQYDTGVVIYFCTDISLNPTTNFTNIEVAPLTIPTAYTVEQVPLDNTQSLPSLSTHMISPVEYRITVKGATHPFILALFESYSPFWNVYIDKSAISPSTHFMLDGYANAWKIDKTGDYTLHILFSPQRYLFIGVLISSITLLIIILFLSMRRRRRAK